MNDTTPSLTALVKHLDSWARAAGFDAVGIANLTLDGEAEKLQAWLEAGYHGSMTWMADRAALRKDPSLLQAGACRVISLRMNYLPENTALIENLKSPQKAYISRYALGRDYHKLIRKRLAGIAENIRRYVEDHGLFEGCQQRAFVDSAPILERPLAEKAGLGWTGKHTLLLHEDAGSWFFLGEILTNIPLPETGALQPNQCGECRACLQVCPTDAFPAPYVLDARRCISYLTIEHQGSIAEEFREAMGNRIYGCDDCQAICPWNKYAQFSTEDSFQPRHHLENSELITLFLWTEAEFLERTTGSAIRRIGYQHWLRNVSIGLGNAPADLRIQEALQRRSAEAHPPWLLEHFTWALNRQRTPSRRKRKLRREG